MPNRPTAQSEATQASAEALVTFKTAWGDRTISEADAQEIIRLLEKSYRLNELIDLAETFCNQLRRIPDSAPNRPLLERIEAVAQLWANKRPSIGSSEDGPKAA